MKRLNLNPTGRTVYKISQPGVEAARQKFTLEPMRFITLEEAAKECGAGPPQRIRNDGDRLRDAEQGSAKLLSAMREALR